MRPHECPHEDALMDAISTGQWPEQCPVSLRAHVPTCAVCRDLAEVATLLHEDGAALAAEIRVPSPGAVWWRAQVRARAEAEHAAMRPMVVAWACAATVLVALVATVLTLGWPWTTTILGDSVAMLSRVQPGIGLSFDVVPVVQDVLDRWTLHLVLAAVLLVAAPVALYFAAWE